MGIFGGMHSSAMSKLSLLLYFIVCSWVLLSLLPESSRQCGCAGSHAVAGKTSHGCGRLESDISPLHLI
jgi:hypothetical protein